MQFPFKIIESKITSRDQFEMVDGYQPSHALFYLKKGSFSMEIDGAEEKMEQGDCVILPDYIHFRRKVLNPIEFVYVKFTYNNTCPYSFEIPCGKVDFKDKPRFLSDISAMERLITNDDPLSAGYREHLLMDILFQIHFEQSPFQCYAEKRICHDDVVSCAAEYIENHIKEKLLISDICRAAGTNASSLNFRFRREFGTSVGRYITDKRIKRAMHLLVSTTYGLSEIAQRCGFDNVYYFSNAFKKSVGVSPSAYRK